MSQEKKYKLPFAIGDSTTFTKTIAECDIYQFAGTTGDFSQMHTNEAFMKTTKYKTRMAHGMLTFSIGVTATTLIQIQAKSSMPSVSYGFDKVRFIRPVFPGDTVTAVYTIVELDEENLKSFGKLEIFNQNQEIVVAATHILKFFPLEETGEPDQAC
ncbi:MaoC family dehydratase N-terminal domain-containing protein [Cuneatibacter sp. NSJ-177]|uniref:MaoC family dehydratase n=1 Tax=Cuneatibacter sp. NSJ-177 TaxID=2931401 RepID=UPI001FD6241A|nr:MaoC/PaaZ C-terminal domain-containing protein [Cuneatibacter sp. NSJ-177]MCJ7835294.1 MaoC family dehydratase N-terminal domain-containing protein [Cuneatibacter sp. NSJ-177]